LLPWARARGGGGPVRAAAVTAVGPTIDGMAHLHRAGMSPSKIDLLDAWVPTQPWFEGPPRSEGTDDEGLRSVAAFRFDDPAGEVGVETIIVATADGVQLQVPLTYRDAPLDGADAHLVGTTEHSVLGTRWVYDGTADPVWAAALATAVLTGGMQAEAWFEVDGERQVREPNSTVVGSGSPGTPVPHVDRLTVDQVEGRTVVTGAAVRIVVARVLGRHDAGALASTGGHTGDHGVEVLTGTWTGHDQPETLAVVLTA
jgi:hypothetical protein